MYTAFSLKNWNCHEVINKFLAGELATAERRRVIHSDNQVFVCLSKDTLSIEYVILPCKLSTPTDNRIGSMTQSVYGCVPCVIYVPGKLIIRRKEQFDSYVQSTMTPITPKILL
jgi:hypothetical protein